MDYVTKNLYRAVRPLNWEDLDRSLLELRVVETEESKMLIGYHIISGALFIIDERPKDEEI